MAVTGDESVSLSQLKEYMDKQLKEYMGNKLYPVNSLFFCTDDTNPASIVGGGMGAPRRGVSVLLPFRFDWNVHICHRWLGC